MGALCGNRCCSGKAIIITHSECMFVALDIQRAMRMRHIVICGLSGSKVFFSTFSHKRHDFREKKLKTKCVLGKVI